MYEGSKEGWLLLQLKIKVGEGGNFYCTQFTVNGGGNAQQELGSRGRGKAENVGPRANKMSSDV